MNIMRSLFPVLLFSCFAAFLPGCQSAQVAQPLTGELAGNAPEDQMAFWHTLAERDLTSNDEAFHALLLFVDGQDDAADYVSRVDALKTRGMLHDDFDEPADHAVTRGTLAVAITKILNIEGGVVMRVFGPSPRYATRELQYQGVYPTSSPQQTFSGDQFVSLIGRVEDYQRRAPFSKSGGNAGSKPKVNTEANPAG